MDCRRFLECSPRGAKGGAASSLSLRSHFSGTTEFPQLKPVKSNTGQRMYRRKDVDAVLRIKKLLYEEGFTIAGARQQLRSDLKLEKNQAPLPFPSQSVSDLRRIRHGLQEILGMLSARR